MTGKIQDSAGDELGINADGSINVNVTAPAVTKVHDFNRAVDVANLATSNHDYAVPAAETFSLKQIIVGSSARLQAIVQVGPIAGLSDIATLYTEKDEFAEVTFAESYNLAEAGGTETVRVARLNRSGTADVESTIIGSY